MRAGARPTHPSRKGGRKDGKIAAPKTPKPMHYTSTICGFNSPLPLGWSTKPAYARPPTNNMN
eukprot:1781642-Alexandrium_andersonii.AAC.1